MIRNSIKYVPSKHVKEFLKDLKEIYQAPTEVKGESSLLALDEKWGRKYDFIVSVNGNRLDRRSGGRV